MRGMADGKFRKALNASGAFLVLATLALQGCGKPDPNNGNFRYRLTVNITVDGVAQSASSVINVSYYGDGTVGPSGASYYSSATGVAPTFDLGELGWLIAAMEPDSSQLNANVNLLGRGCKMAVSVMSLPGFYQLKASELENSVLQAIYRRKLCLHKIL